MLLETQYSIEMLAARHAHVKIAFYSNCEMDCGMILGMHASHSKKHLLGVHLLHKKQTGNQYQ